MNSDIASVLRLNRFVSNLSSFKSLYKETVKIKQVGQLVLMGHLKKYFSADFRLCVWITSPSEWLTDVDYQRDWENYPRKFERILKLFKFLGKNFKTQWYQFSNSLIIHSQTNWYFFDKFCILLKTE